MYPNPFDLSSEYDKMLDLGLKLSGENKHFFAERRIRDLKSHLPLSFNPRRILDFGCGIGDTVKILADAFPQAEIIGVDTAERALVEAKKKYGSHQVSFYPLRSFSESCSIDLCYTNGVFHHIQPEDRIDVLRMIRGFIVPGGYFALSENNPWNPGTNLVMRRIPFDRDAHPLTLLQTRYLLREGGFSDHVVTRFLFFFPRPFAFLRFSESWLARVPLGAQYYVLVRK